MMSETWLPSRFADPVTWRALETTPLYKLLAQQGVVVGQVIQEVTAEIADPLKAQLMDTHIGDALLRRNRLFFDTDLNPVQYQSLFLSPTKSRILMHISADRIDSAESGLVAHDVSHGSTD
jgi:GntR family transcriptional regulator